MPNRGLRVILMRSRANIKPDTNLMKKSAADLEFEVNLKFQNGIPAVKDVAKHMMESLCYDGVAVSRDNDDIKTHTFSNFGDMLKVYNLSNGLNIGVWASNRNSKCKAN